MRGMSSPDCQMQRRRNLMIEKTRPKGRILLRPPGTPILTPRALQLGSLQLVINGAMNLIKIPKRRRKRCDDKISTLKKQVEEQSNIVQIGDALKEGQGSNGNNLEEKHISMIW